MELRPFLLIFYVGNITYLYVSRLEECKAYQSKGNSCFGPQEDLFNIKAEKVVRFFLLFKVNTNKFVFLNKLSIDYLFYGFLDHHNRYDL